ncbi:MAG: hypothetical protein VX112_04845 [Pseudomonadota bacterium]|nr:hypothetical protein [Pseudomonadota bacterium]
MDIAKLNYTSLQEATVDTPAENAVSHIKDRQHAMHEEISYMQSAIMQSITNAENLSDKDIRDGVKSVLAEMRVEYQNIGQALSNYYSENKGNENFDRRYLYPLSTFKNILVIDKAQFILEQTTDFLINLSEKRDLQHSDTGLSLASINFSEFSDQERDPNNIPWLGGSNTIESDLGINFEHKSNFWGTPKPSILIHSLVATRIYLESIEKQNEHTEKVTPAQHSTLFYDYALPDDLNIVDAKYNIFSNSDGKYLRIYSGGYAFGGIGTELAAEGENPYAPMDCSSYIAEMYQLPFRVSTLHLFNLQRSMWGEQFFTALNTEEKHLVETLQSSLQPQLDFNPIAGDVWVARKVPKETAHNPTQLGRGGHVALWLGEANLQENKIDKYGLFAEFNRDISEERDNMNGIDGFGFGIRPTPWMNNSEGNGILPDSKDSNYDIVHGLQRPSNYK